MARLVGVQIGPRITGTNYFQSMLGPSSNAAAGGSFSLARRSESLTSSPNALQLILHPHTLRRAFAPLWIVE